jgi:hypothetical protein
MDVHHVNSSLHFLQWWNGMHHWHDMPLTWPHKMVSSTWNNKSQNNGHGWDSSFVFDINNNPSIEPMFCKHFVDLQNNGTLRNFNYLKNLMVTWQGFHLSFKKYTMRISTFTPTLNIYKSKLTMQVLQYSRVEEMYFSSIFWVILGKISLTTIHIDGKQRHRFCFITSLLKNEA